MQTGYYHTHQSLGSSCRRSLPRSTGRRAFPRTACKRECNRFDVSRPGGRIELLGLKVVIELLVFANDRSERKSKAQLTSSLNKFVQTTSYRL